MTGPEAILYAAGGYLAFGLLIGLVFVAVGIGRVDTAAKGSSIGFRLLILPGCAAFWPVVLLRWIRSPQPAKDKAE